jgi:hypothetical protein
MIDLMVVGALALVLGFIFGRSVARDDNEERVLKRIIKRRVDKRVNAIYTKTGAEVERELAALVNKIAPEEEVDPRD